MQITHFGHAAILVSYEVGRDSSATRILIDPGTLARAEVASLTDLDAILVTHQHPDHACPKRLAALLDANPDAAVYLEPDTAEALSSEDLTAPHQDRFGILPLSEKANVGPVSITAAGSIHATIHPDIPAVGNYAYILEAEGEKTLAHMGDSLIPHRDILGIDVLAFPVVAPWSKMQETIDFLRIVKPGIALPIHDGVASPEGRAIYIRQASALALEGTEVTDWPETHTLTL